MRMPRFIANVAWAIVNRITTSTRKKIQASQDPATVPVFIASLLEPFGVDRLLGAAIGEFVARGGVIMVGGISTTNDRPFVMGAVHPKLAHARRREVFDAIAAEIPTAIARTIDVPGR